MNVDSVGYYWLKSDWLDANELILTEKCDLYCIYGSWTGFGETCLPEFKDSIWTRVWEK